MSNPERPRYPSSARERRPKCCIVGFTDHKKDAPFGDPSFEIWGLNEMHRYIEPEKFARWFEVHKRADLDADKQHIETLANMPIPVYMQEHYDDIPPSFAFPKEAVEADVGSYMTSSIAWQMGLAIHEGFEEIHIYGVDMAQETEYAEQRNCVEYLIGKAEGRGIKVFVPPTSDLLKSLGQYGWGTDGSLFSLKLAERMAWLEREREQFKAGLASLKKQYDDKLTELNAAYAEKHDPALLQLQHIEGSILDCDYWKRSWAVPGDGKPGEPHIDRSKDPRTGIKSSTDQLTASDSERLKMVGEG